ncbi:MAG: HDIG domain-containing protein [Erysipelothrix sp.]|nr:HDIG domain-containing protein [Erysipelothrix sp.]
MSLIENEYIQIDLLSKNGELNFHLVNVAILSGLIGQYCELSQRDLIIIILGSVIHDIGKQEIPIEILDKPGKLSIVEKNLINTHPYEGLKILAKFNLSQEVLDIVQFHHQYIKELPKAIKLKDIVQDHRAAYPIICSVADVTDAVISKRAYKLSLSPTVSRDDLLKKGILDIDEIYKAIGIILD